MSLVAIIGPMKSGKSLELIARIAPYAFANQSVVLIQPELNVRDKGVTSRIGITYEAQKLKSLGDLNGDYDVIGIDEIHMFAPEDVEVIEKWLTAGKEIFVSGLDVGYDQKLTPTMKKILELKPDQTVDKLAVCELCKSYSARFTKILKNGKVVRRGLPSVVPEDGTYSYQTNCRTCFGLDQS